MKARLLLVAVVHSAMVSGCIALTGGTDGYVLGDSGSTAGSCGSSVDCSDSGGVCCLSLGASTAAGSAVGTCQQACASSLPQLCAASSQCGDAGACSLQSCSAGAGLTFMVQTCGTITGCNGTD